MRLLNTAARFVFVALLTTGATIATAGPTENLRDGREPRPDVNGNIPQKIIHRVSPGVATPGGAAGHGPGGGLAGAQPPAGSMSANASPIYSHGGPVMPALSKIVLIWYGSWGGTSGTNSSAGQQIVRDAVFGLAKVDATGTSYYGPYQYADVTAYSQSNPFSDYTDATHGPVTAVSSTAIAECTQPASRSYGGTKLSDAYVLKLVQWAASNACSIPANSSSVSGPDPAAIYLVLSSSDISESSGFLTKYCGWHTYSTMNGVPVKYGFVGNPAKSLGSCSYQTASSPNGNPGVDAMISVIAHELEETVTDPQLNAWYNAQGSENGDMCAWTFGSAQHMISSTDPFYLGSSNSNAYYNVVLPATSAVGGAKGTGYRPYLVQRALRSGNSACYVNAYGAVQ